MDLVRGAVLLLATLAMGLQAGLFYAFSVSVMPGLGRGDDRTFVAAMQQINAAIQNPWFFVTFLGAPVLTVVALLLHLRSEVRGVLPWIVAGLVLSVALLVITVRVNIPLNDALAAADLRDGTGPGTARDAFEATWVWWNVVRAVLSTVAFGALAWALLLSGRAMAAAAG